MKTLPSEMIYLKAPDVDRAVRELYTKSGCIVLSEVRNGTGYERSARTADMLAVSTWPSRGLFVEGIEIKVSRSDLARELCEPAKADSIAKYCKRWWLATPRGLVADQLIPETWGVIEVDEKLKARIVKQAVSLEPQSLDALFVCSILRNFSETFIHISEIQERITAAREDEQRAVENRLEYRNSFALNAVQSFKEASGIDLMGDYGHPIWDMGRVGESIQLLRAMKSLPGETLRDARTLLGDAIKSLDGALSVIGREL